MLRTAKAKAVLTDPPWFEQHKGANVALVIFLLVGLIVATGALGCNVWTTIGAIARSIFGF